MTVFAGRALQALYAIPEKLDLGPHTRLVLEELIRASRAEHHLSIIILAATLVDIVTHEGADELDPDLEDSFGLSMLRADERCALDKLRAMRNSIVHYQGLSEGLSNQPQDAAYLKEQAEAAIHAVLPVLELQEIY
jgi:hypothetical protein